MCDEAIIVHISGRSGSYTYSWFDLLGQTTAAATNLCAGTYQVIITDTLGWIDSATVSIFDPQPLFSSVMATNDTYGSRLNRQKGV